MDKEQRVTIRLAGPLRRVLEREAAEQGVTLSEHIRRLVLASRPHLPVLEEVGRVMEAGKASTTPREYLPYLINMAQRIQEGLQALEGFEAMSAQWRQEAQRELTAALADVQERMQQFTGLVNMGEFFAKPQGEDTADERSDQPREG